MSEVDDTLFMIAGTERVSRKAGTGGTTRKVDDVDLFRRFLDGDDTAFLELFDRHAARLGRYCRKMVRDEVLAEDVVQDLWEKIVRLRESDRGVPHNPLGLFYWMARNLCLNFIRDHRKHTSLDDLQERFHPTAPGVREFSQLEELVVLALEHLPLAQREVLILNAYAGYSFEEIAVMMDESDSAVRTRAWRARRQLKRIIAALIELDENNDDDGNDTNNCREDCP